MGCIQSVHEASKKINITPNEYISGSEQASALIYNTDTSNSSKICVCAGGTT